MVIRRQSFCPTCSLACGCLTYLLLRPGATNVYLILRQTTAAPFPGRPVLPELYVSVCGLGPYIFIYDVRGRCGLV